MSRSLKRIQGLSKAGLILSRIALGCSIAGFIFCLVGAIAMGVLEETASVQLGDITIHSILEKECSDPVGTIWGAVFSGAVMFLGEILISARAASFFRFELDEGAPFTVPVADKMKKLGIFTIVVSTVTIVLASTAYAVCSHFMPGAADLDLDNWDSIAIGIMFIVMSIVCRYGAELNEANGPVEAAAEEEEVS